MTKDQDFKVLVRARMKKTGESYTTARERLLEQRGMAEAAGPASATQPYSGFGCGKCGAPIVDAEDYRRHLEQEHGYKAPPVSHDDEVADDPGAQWINQMHHFLYGADVAVRATAARAKLRDHLEARYGIEVKEVLRLDGDVYRVNRLDGPAWVARMFPSARSLDVGNGDAAALRFLEQAGFPAERCAHDEPVSVLDGHAVLVTEHIEGIGAQRSVDAVGDLGDLLGRLHTLAGLPRAVARPAGALHYWNPDGGGLREDLGTAMSWLEDAGGRFPSSDRPRYDALRARVADAEDGNDLPQAFVHPDFQPGNAIASPTDGLVLFDWTGAGVGPRVSSLGDLLSLSVSRATLGPNLELVDAAVAGYRTHVELEPEELDRLAPLMRARDAVLDCFYFGIGVKGLPELAKDWAAKDELTEAIAARARQAMTAA
jgi:Ser/Thr protein kinase RdoA (MazF antagonist)